MKKNKHVTKLLAIFILVFVSAISVGALYLKVQANMNTYTHFLKVLPSLKKGMSSSEVLQLLGSPHHQEGEKWVYDLSQLDGFPPLPPSPGTQVVKELFLQVKNNQLMNIQQTSLDATGLAPSFILRGKIMGDKGAPLPQAKARLCQVPPLNPSAPVGPIQKVEPDCIETISGPDGEFALSWTKQKKGEFILECEKDGYYTYRSRLKEISATPLTIEMSLK